MAKIGLNLSDYWLIIRKRKLVLIVCFLGIVLSVIFQVRMQTPVYRAVCSIRLIERKSVSDMITEMVSYTSYDIMASMTKVLAGRPIVEKVVYELGLVSEKSSPEEVNNAILGIQGAIQAENERMTNIVNIIVNYHDPAMAAAIANTVAEVFIRADMDEKNEQAHKMRIFLEEQSAKAEEKLAEIENKLKFFKESGEATGVGATLQSTIDTLERKKLELREIFTEKYPDVVKITEQIEDLKEQLRTLPESEIEFDRLSREFQASEAAYSLLKTRLQGARIAEAERIEDIKIVDPAVAPKNPIKPNKPLATTLGVVVGLVVGIFMCFVIETLDTSIGTIDDLQSLLGLPVLAVIPYMKPLIKEKKFWFSLASAFKVFNRDTRHRNVEHMRQQLLIKHDQKSATTEAYRILRTNIRVEELLENDQRILLITSTIPQEGKSITSANFALALAQDGYRVVLVDCDLRKAVVHKMFKIEKAPGLTDALLDFAQKEAVVRNFVDLMVGDVEMRNTLNIPGLDNLHVIPCGTIVANPAELLGSPKTDEFFAYLKSQFNFVIIDSAPVLPVPDTIILGRKVAERLYLVYRASYTSRVAILRAKDQLDRAKVSPVGVILNSTTPESQIISDYYHEYYHYRYYSEPEKKVEKADKGKI